MSHVLPTYPRSNLTFTHGEGSHLIDDKGDKYLDFGAGIAVNSLGYNHPYLNEKLREQSEKLWHVSNVYQIPAQEELAERLCNVSFADYAFFCNSGTESIEAAIKIARRYFYINENSKTKNKIISFSGSFHGRTLGALAAGGASKLEGFNTPMEGFVNLPYGDHDKLHDALDENVAAILIEPIQGEGGVTEIPKQCLEGLRAICDEKNILLIFDEVQCGIGRTGKMFAHQWSDVRPDIMTIAKALGNGFPIGACLTTKKVGECMSHGTHGSTFGGNPLACVIGNSVLDILDNNFMSTLLTVAEGFQTELNKTIKDYPNILSGIRGRGLMLGLKCLIDNVSFVEKARENKILTIKAADNVVRLLPPLNISANDCNEAIVKIRNTCKQLS